MFGKWMLVRDISRTLVSSWNRRLPTYVSGHGRVLPFPCTLMNVSVNWTQNDTSGRSIEKRCSTSLIRPLRLHRFLFGRSGTATFHPLWWYHTPLSAIVGQVVCAMIETFARTGCEHVKNLCMLRCSEEKEEVNRLALSIMQCGSIFIMMTS